MNDGNGADASPTSYEARKAAVESIRSIFVEYDRITELKQEFADLVTRDNAASEGGIILLTGAPGSGKTQLITDFIRNYPAQPRAIVKPNGDVADRAPVVSFEVSDLGLKAMTEDMFAKLSGLDASAERRKDIEQDIVHYAREMETRLFIFEEVHSATQDRQPKTLAAYARFFKRMSNKSMFSLLLVGTEDAKQVVAASPELERRVLATLEVSGFDWNDVSEREDFLEILDGIDERLATVFGRKSGLAEPNVAVRIHRAAEGGTIGLAARLIERAAILVLRELEAPGDHSVTPAHLARAYESQRLTKGGFNPFTSDMEAVPQAAATAKGRSATGRGGGTRRGGGRAAARDRNFRP